MIYDRLWINEKYETFIPSKVEYSEITTRFWNMKKGIIVLLMGTLLPVVWIITGDATFMGKLLLRLGLFISYIFITRFFIFEEKHYLKVYKRIQKYNKSPSSILWGISYVNQTPSGCSVGFINGAIGCFIGLERGSLIGKPENYLEMMDEQMSNFLHDCISQNYNVRLCQSMELASKDPRLNYLNDVIKDEQNPNIRELLELNTNYMRSIADHSYYETDIILIYTFDYLRLNSIVDDAINLTSQLLRAGFLTRRVLNESDLINLHTELNNIEYFDIVSARNELYEADVKIKNKRKLNIVSLNFKNGNQFKLNDFHRKNLTTLYNIYERDRGQKLDIIKSISGKLEDIEMDQKILNKKVNTNISNAWDTLPDNYNIKEYINDDTLMNKLQPQKEESNKGDFIEL